MNFLSSEDLKAAGFVPYRFPGGDLPSVLVHKSIPPGQMNDSYKVADYPHVFFDLNYGWEAKWGAVRFHLRNETLLGEFMKKFHYPLPINEQNGTTD